MSPALAAPPAGDRARRDGSLSVQILARSRKMTWTGLGGIGGIAFAGAGRESCAGIACAICSFLIRGDLCGSVHVLPVLTNVNPDRGAAVVRMRQYCGTAISAIAIRGATRRDGRRLADDAGAGQGLARALSRTPRRTDTPQNLQMPGPLADLFLLDHIAGMAPIAAAEFTPPRMVAMELPSCDTAALHDPPWEVERIEIPRPQGNGPGSPAVGPSLQHRRRHGPAARGARTDASGAQRRRDRPRMKKAAQTAAHPVRSLGCGSDSAAPAADGAAIHVDEVRSRIATDAAGPAGDRGLRHLVHAARAEPKVGRLAADVK